MTNNEQRRRLRELYRDGVISEETYKAAIGKVPEERKLDIFVNFQGMLVIVYAYGQQKWTIRVPLVYSWFDYIRENYPMSVSIQGRKNRALWKILGENRNTLNQLDIERKEKYLPQSVKGGEKSEPKGKTSSKPCNPALVALAKNQKSKSRVMTVTQSGGW